TKRKLGRLFLACLVALNGLPAATASSATPDRTRVLSECATALGVRGDLTKLGGIITIDYDSTGTIAVNGEPCQLTAYRVRLNYALPGMRREFSCIDANGQTHHETQ